MEKNQKVRKVLDRYVNLEIPPEYAVLLTGKWGSGKTYFIDKFLEDKKNIEKKFIRISLFGMKNSSEIDDEVFTNLYPVFGNKYVKLGTNILKSSAKFGIKTDDFKASFNSDESKFFNFKEKDNLVFIFDDLERTKIELIEVLGYINSLVEISKFKVVILADESKLEEEEEYLKFKEKVIGKTVEIEQDLKSAFEHFLEVAPKSKEVLKDNFETMQEVFQKADYKNLRHVRQAIMDFEEFYELIEDRFLENREFLKIIIFEFFIYSIEIKSGNLKIEDIGQHSYLIQLNIKNTSQEIESEKKELTESEKEQIAKLQKQEDRLRKFARHIFNNEFYGIIKSFLLNGLTKEIASNYISGTRYFSEQKSWEKLGYSFPFLEEEEFNEVLKEVSEKFENFEYTTYMPILVVSDVLLELSKSNIYSKKSQDEIVEIAIKSTDIGIKDHKEEFKSKEHKHTLYSGKFQNEKFQEIYEYVDDYETTLYNLLKQETKENFVNNFSSDNFEKIFKEHEHIPLFLEIDANTLFSKIKSSNNKTLFLFYHIIKNRYKRFYEDFSEELPFWQNLLPLLEAELENLDSSKYIKKYNLNLLKEQVEKVIEKLEK
jgi:hypothetical protein